MVKMFLIFSHSLTDEQRQDAIKSLNVDEFLDMPPDLKNLWMNISPMLESLNEYLTPFRDWLKNTASSGDYVFIHGDPGAVYLLVTYSFGLGLLPVYSTTRREVLQEVTEDNMVWTKKVFRHCLFRFYGK